MLKYKRPFTHAGQGHLISLVFLFYVTLGKNCANISKKCHHHVYLNILCIESHIIISCELKCYQKEVEGLCFIDTKAGVNLFYWKMLSFPVVHEYCMLILLSTTISI